MKHSIENWKISSPFSHPNDLSNMTIAVDNAGDDRSHGISEPVGNDGTVAPVTPVETVEDGNVQLEVDEENANVPPTTRSNESNECISERPTMVDTLATTTINVVSSGDHQPDKALSSASNPLSNVVIEARTSEGGSIPTQVEGGTVPSGIVVESIELPVTRHPWRCMLLIFAIVMSSLLLIGLILFLFKLLFERIVECTINGDADCG
jgi:hypothetical protein